MTKLFPSTPDAPKAKPLPLTDPALAKPARLELPNEDRERQKAKARGLDALRIDPAPASASGLNLPRL